MLMRKRVNPLVYVAFDSEASVFSPFAGGDPARTRKTTAGFFHEGVLHDDQALKESTFETSPAGASVTGAGSSRSFLPIVVSKAEAKDSRMNRYQFPPRI